MRRVPKRQLTLARVPSHNAVNVNEVVVDLARQGMSSPFVGVALPSTPPNRKSKSQGQGMGAQITKTKTSKTVPKGTDV